MNPKKRNDCICVNCGKQFYPAYNMSGKYCSNKCQMEYQSKLKYQEYLQYPEKYKGQSILACTLFLEKKQSNWENS